jgi:AcrR family transcriptional regulator
MKPPKLKSPAPGKSTRRPSPEVRRAAILDAAALVFFEQGYSAASIDSIIERIGGSKRNIYNEFGSKEGLFTALVSEISEKVMAALSDEEIRDQDLHRALIGIGHRLM